MIIKNIVSSDNIKLLTHHILRLHEEQDIINLKLEDSLVSIGSSFSSHSNPLFDTLCEIVWPIVELKVGVELIPTYAYSRLYVNGSELPVHLDRPSCEVSVTIQLGRSHHYAWPIFIGSERFDLAEGDGVLYKGTEEYHWRNVCDGPKDYYSAQIFLHYVKRKGSLSEWAGDKRWSDAIPFKKNRTWLLENK